MNSRFLAPKTRRLTKPFFLLSLFLFVPFLAEAQCPPTITVTNAPGCNLTYTPPIATLCSGDSCTLTSSAGTGTYQWFKGGTPITDATSNVYYPTTAGFYTVEVGGCITPSSQIEVKINPKPFGFINFSPTSPVCEGTTVTVELEPDPGSPYDDMSWWKPDGIVGNTNPFTQRFYTTTTIRAIVSNNISGCTNVVSNTLVVQSPISPGAITANQAICSGTSPLELSGPAATGGDGIFTYQWQSSTNSGVTWSDIPGATSLNYQPGILTQTTLFRRVVYSNSPCPAVTQYTPVTITVNEIPTITSPAAVSICSNSALNYTPTSNVSGTTFAWTGVNTSGTVNGVSANGTGAINDALSIAAGSAVSGTATYTIIPTGPAPTFCVGDPFYLVVTVNPLPSPTITGPTPVCSGSSGNLYATDPGMSNYIWTISPGGVINSGQGTYEVSVTWTTTGSRWVRVIYTGGNTCSPLSPTQYNVTVNPLPDPVITGPNAPCLGASGNVYSSTAGMTNYIWNVSPGGTITGSGSPTDNTAIVTWNSIGVQWISLTYTDVNGCTNTTPKQYLVNVSAPTLTGPQSPCLGSTGNVYTAGSGNTDYVWTVSPGGTITSGGGSTNNTATITWNATGAQTVSVNYKTAAGCTAALPATLNVDVKPLPTPTISGSNSVCAGTTGVVYTTESGKSLYTWTISAGGTITAGGTPGSNTATVTWNNAGPQQISVNYTDSNGCSAESPTVYPVTVNPQPTPTITGSNSECVGTTGVVYSTEIGMSNYVWTISGGTITSGAGTNSVVVTWTTVGSRWVAVNYTGASGCNATAPTQYPVTVLPLPAPTVTGPNAVCVDATNVEYSTEIGMSGYQWTVPTGGTIVGSSTNNTVYVTWNTVGSHTVSVTYTGTNGCAAATPTNYNVSVNPLPTPSITGPADVCRNSTANIYTTQPGMTNYVWSISGGTITSGGNGNNSAIVTWNTTGNQSISVNYEQTGCPATSPTVYPVFVNPLPIVDAGSAQSIQNGTSTVLNGTASGGTGALSYQWTPVNLIASGATSLTPTTENIYLTQIFELEVTDSKLCASSDQVVITALGDPLSVVASATPEEICNNGATVQLGATANGGNSSIQADYTWTSTPAGFTSNAQNPIANPTVTTTYNVSVWDGFNAATNTILVTVHPLPTAFNVTGGGEYCSGGTGVSVGLNGSQTGVNYQLLLNGADIGAPIAGTGGAITFTNNTAAGVYTIRAIHGTTSCERNMAGSVTISINQLPTSFAGNSELIPYGTNTTLTGVAGAGTPPYDYLWTPAASINGSNTSLTATTTNLFTNTAFTFRVTDSKNCVANDIVNITLDGSALAVTATAVQDIICNNGETVQLNASATGGNSATQVNYSWTSTPAGFTSTEQSPQVNPTQTTIYYISVNDGFNTATNSVTVTVNPLPTPFTVTGGGEYCNGGGGLAVGLNGSQVGVNYQLLRNGFNIGAPVAGTGAAISFGNQTNAGLFTVHATNGTTTCERIMTGNTSIAVNPLPVASAGVDISINHGTSTTLNGSASSGTSPWGYLWSPANMINSGANTSTPVTENLFTTTAFDLTVTDAKGCTDTDHMQVIVLGNPLSVNASVNNSTLCSGAAAQLTATGSGGNLIYTYSWSSNPVGWTSTEQNPVINPTVTTDYTVTINDGYNTATSSVNVVVNPLAAVYDVTGGGSYCSGDAGIAVGLSNSEIGVNYQLYRNGTSVGSAVSGTGSPISFGLQTGAGSYTVKATTAITGCENDMAATVNINILPLPTIYTMTGGGSYPQGGIGVIVGITNSQIGVNYQLLLNGSDIGAPVAGTGSPLDFGYQTGAGDYTAIGIDAVTGCDIEMSSTATVIINPYPSIFHVYGGGSICAGSSVEVGLDGSEIGVAYTLSRDGTSVLVDVPGTGDSLNFGVFSTQGIYTVRAKNITTGLTRNMDGNAEIIVNPLPIPYSLSYFQPGDNCAPIIPRLGGSEIGAVYELNYEDFNGFYTAAIETINGTGNPFNFSSQTNPGIYTVSAYIDYTNVICSIDMIGSLVADSLPKEFQITPQGQLCENDQELCLAGSEAGINYRLWLNGQPVGAIVPGDINGGPICFGTLNAPGTYRINAINTITGCEIFYANQVVVNPQPIKYVMFPVADCAGSEIILEDCELGIDYYLYHEPATKEFIEVQGPLTCAGSGPLNFGPQVDEGVYRIKAVNPATNCWTWMDGSTTLYPNPEIFDISPQSGGCAPLAIYLENFETDATYYLYRGATLVTSIAGSTGSVNFGLQSVAGTYTVKAKITHPGGLECWSDMSGEVIIYNSAAVFTLTPQGPSCPDPAVTFRLSGSEPAVNYTLWHDVSGIKETIVGTGLAFNFSPQSEPGQYWVIASTGNACQTQMNGIGVIHEMPASYTITPSGQFCSNDNLEIGLSNSDLGVTYYLYRANTAITPPVIVAGTGNAISFGINNWIAGTYTVMAIDDATSCERLMDGILVLSNPPNIYAVMANGVIATSGLYCAPATIGLALSQLGVDYTLHSPDGNNITLAGTGFPLDFGPFSYPGEYSITAFNSATACSSNMTGTVNIYDGPEVFVLVSLTDPLYCFGDNSAIELVLNYSQIGARYQLYRDTDANPVFAAQPGTGGSLSWTAVSQHGPGDYYVKSSFIANPTCSAVMDGVIPVEEIDLPTAALSGTETICSSYCTDLVFNITASKAFTLTYTANNQLQAPVSFNPGDDFRIQVCPTVNTEYEIQSIEYTEFPYCVGTAISGTFDVIVEPLPAVTVNNPGTTCITTPFTTNVTTSNTSTYEWIIINGNGSISPNNTENITYTPAAGDEGTTVILQLTAFGLNTCSAESVSELVEINVEPIPQIDMGPDGLICETGTFTTNTTIDFGSAYLWEIISGNGTINPNNQQNTTYTAAPGDGGTTVQLKLTVTGEGTCVNETVSDFLDIVVEELPTADAGAGGIICESETFQLNGSATNHTTVFWEVINGIGSFDDATLLNAVFTPGDISNFTAMTLRLTVAGAGSCNGETATSEVIIEVDPLPEAEAGLGGIICETQGYHFANASVRNNSGFVWEIHDGTGHFDDPLHLSPVFYPDPVTQITDMTLRLVAYGINNCSTTTDTSFVIITVHPQPVAYAGAGGETCVNTPFALADATAQHQSSVLWEVISGEGSIDSPLNVNPNYIPNAADAGTVVTLKLTAFGAGPCSSISTNDFVNIFIQGLPIVDAGPSLQTCFLDPITITQASASNYEQIIWTHDGNGTLNNSNTISPTYIPAAGDEGNTITLTLSAEGLDSCIGELATDQTTILVAPLPTAFAGLDATICELENYTILDASATFESSVVWSVISGSGSITQPFLVNTTYIPAASDAGTTVRLRLTVYGRGNCAAYSSFDEINISVVESPIALFSVDTPVCENEVVSFTDLSSTTAGIIEQWVWDFGDGSAPITIDFPDNPNVSHLYTLQGAYTVSLLVTTTNGCTNLYSTEINISPAPVAAYDYNGGLCAESEVNFIDLSQVNGGGNIMSWNWDFGDGTFSTEQNPSHIFNAAGDYVVSLTVTNMANCVSQTFVQTITIGDPITVTIDDTDLIACLNDPHQFDGISPEAVWWNWDFGDGATSTLQNPTHTYTSVGNYTVTLTGSDINGCQNVDVVMLTVSPNPIAFFTADQSACANEEINFIDGSISPNGQITEWLWEMGDGTVIGPITNPADRNVVHQYTFAGSYEVTLTVTDINGCTDDFSSIVIIENGPLANFTFQAACEGQAVIFTDLSTPNGGSDLLSWQWDFGDPLSGTNNTSNLQNPSHIFIGPMPAGGYTVSLTVTNTQGCFNTILLPVEVNQNQTITITADTNPICLGNPMLFSSDATNVVSWQWNFGDGSTSAQPNPAHTYQFAGNYNVTLTIQDGNGCTATANLPIEVNELPTANFSNTTPGCLNEPISFTDLSVSPNGAIVDWLWDFGDGNTSTDQNPTNEYLTAGTFVVSLSVTDATGCADTYQKTITIKTAPIANFAFDAACIGQPVIFTDLSSVNNGSNIIGWQWNFGDPASGTANNSTVQNPTHIFVGNMPVGGFTVSLTITNVEGCTDLFETQVELNEAQTITITTDNDVHCLGEIVQFNSNATNVESWLWNFGDGNTSTQANPTHIYQFTGNYNVTLTIQDANGCTASDAHQIEVNELPTANFSNSTPGCPDETIHFTDLSISPNGGIVNWHWEFGDGDEAIIDAPDDPNVDHIYANPGTYNVTLTVTDVTGCEDSFTRQIVTENAPLANFTFTQTCFGEPVLFTDLSSPNGGSDLFSWEWDFGDPLSGVNNSSTLQNPSHLFTAAGVYNVSLTVTNTQGCSDTFTAEITVSETVDIDFSFASAAFCPGEIIDFTPTGVDIVSYDWSFGDGGTSIQQTPTYIYTQPGTYTVSLLVTAIDGCQGYVEHDVVINEEPIAAFSTSSPSCSGSPTQFFNASSSPTGYITEWIWNFGDGSPEVVVAFPDNPDVEYTYTVIGTYNATLTVTNSNGCSNSISHEVIVAPGPIAAFDHSGSCAESPVSFTDLSQENGGGVITNWQWNFDDLASGTANTSTLQNPVHSFTAPGDYNVELIITNINGCTASVTNTITIDDALVVDITVDNETPCLGTPVNFSGTAAGAVIWLWDFGDGNTATVQNPSHTYITTGAFTVSLTAETAEGCSNTATLNVVVNPAPVSRFISTSPACSSDSVHFVNQSTTPNGFIQTFIWDMGDGSEPITVEDPGNPNVAYLYTLPGTYEVSLTVIDDSGCENTSSKLVQVEAGPIADFTQDESCFGTPTLFTDLTSTNGGSDLYSWQWWFDDPNSGINNTSTLQNPSHRFTEAGTFTVTLIATNTSGCSHTIEKEVIVKELPAVDFTIVNDQLCLNTAAEFTGIGENINTWFWEFGDGGTSYGQNTTYLYAEPGQYTVTLTVTGINQCQNSISYPIFINDAPIADFSVDNTCLEESTQFFDQSISLYGFIEAWEWDFGDGNNATEQNPEHVFENADDYLVTLTVTDNFGCFETISRWVSIYEKPTAAFSFNQVCDPVGRVFFFNESEISPNGSPILEYEWNFHDGYFSNDINPNHTFPETDTCYVVSLTITDAFGCESIATDTICIWEPLTVDFTATEVCLGFPTFFETSYLPADDSIVSYAWNFNDGSPIFLTYRDTTSHIFPVSGTFFVELTTTNLNGCKNTIYREVKVNGLPLPDFSYLPGLCDDPVAFTDLSEGNGALVQSWSWDFGDPDSGGDNFSDLRNPSHLYSDQGGTYQVKLTVTNFNGCVDSITKEVIQDPCVQASFIVPNITLCADATICFIDESHITVEDGSIDRWIWNFGDNTLDYVYTELENPVCHDYLDREGGDFVVTLTIEATVNGSPFSHTHTETITIYPKPTARFIPAPVCQNTSAQFTDNSLGNGSPITNWFWNFGDETTVHDTSSTQNPAYRYPDFGLFDVQLVVSNEFDCSDTLISEIEIYQPPTADYIAVDSCATYITYFNDLTVAGGAPINNYFWHFGDPGSNNSDGNHWTDSTSTDRWAEHIYNNPGTYFATLVVEDGNSCRDTLRQSLPVHPIPAASFTYEDRYQGKQGQVLFENTSDATATSFFWDFMTAEGDFSTEENPVFQFRDDGIYDVMLVAYNNHMCPDTAINPYEIVFTGLYFPNTFAPNSEDPKVNNFKGLGENLLTYQLEVYTSWGQLIWSSTALIDGKPAEAWDGTYNNQDLPIGSYIWKASASFKDGTIWEGSDNGDGNLKTYGILNLIR